MPTARCFSKSIRMNPHFPQHVAFIMDGNGRWATRRGLSRLKGHAEGIETVKRVCEELSKLEVPYATFYAFSTENWKRPWEEVSGLFSLMRTFFNREIENIIAKGMRVRFIGDRSPASKLPADILELMTEVESRTAHNSKLTATFAVNYSGRDELLRAAKTMAESAANGQLNPAEITAATLESALDTHGLPDPDLIIRTSGEQRLSNFLLWQLAYAELYFSDVAWPDFQTTHLQAALNSFAMRQRRFGALPETTAA